MGQPHRVEKDSAPEEWSWCSWVMKTPAIDSGSIPRARSRRSISRPESPASTRTRVVPHSTTHAFPPDPEARTLTRTESG